MGMNHKHGAAGRGELLPRLNPVGRPLGDLPPGRRHVARRNAQLRTAAQRLARADIEVAVAPVVVSEGHHGLTGLRVLPDGQLQNVVCQVPGCSCKRAAPDLRGSGQVKVVAGSRHCEAVAGDHVHWDRLAPQVVGERVPGQAVGSDGPLEGWRSCGLLDPGHAEDVRLDNGGRVKGGLRVRLGRAHLSERRPRVSGLIASVSVNASPHLRVVGGLLLAG